MEHGLIIAGFGGQGVLFTGRVLAEAALLDGRHVTWYPSYGPEQRGGTCNCSVVISDSPIGSPVIDRPDSLLILNRPSWDKFTPLLHENSQVIYNSDLVNDVTAPKVGRSVPLPASDLAAQAGDGRVANMVLLGAFSALNRWLPLECIITSLKALISERHRQLLDIDINCIKLGRNFITAGSEDPQKTSSA